MGNRHDLSAVKQSLKDKLMAIILLETSKDYKKMDSDLVKECVDFLMELEGKERLTKAEIEQRVNAIPFKGKVTAIDSYTKKRLRAKRLAVVAAILAVLLALFGIISVASGNTLDELFRQIGNYIFELSEGSTMERDNITFIKPNETKTYSSIEELAESEGIEILYPTWLPENEKIIEIWYMVDGELKEFDLQNSTPEHSMSIKVNKELTETLKSNCIKREILGYTIYYEETPLYTQANFIYKNNLYVVKSDTEDNLFKIIENLKEIS